MKTHNIEQPKNNTNSMENTKSSRKRTYEIEIARISIDGNISLALDLYEIDKGVFPSSKEGLKILLRKSRTAAPYIRNKKSLKDPWENPYVYYYPSKTEGKYYYDLSSNGPDGEENTDDDIVKEFSSKENEEMSEEVIAPNGHIALFKKELESIFPAEFELDFQFNKRGQFTCSGKAEKMSYVTKILDDMKNSQLFKTCKISYAKMEYKYVDFSLEGKIRLDVIENNEQRTMNLNEFEDNLYNE